MKTINKYLVFSLATPLLLILIMTRSFAQDQEAISYYQTGVVPVEATERLRAIFEGSDYSVKSFRGNWNPDGSGYMVLETSGDANLQSLVTYEAASGRRTVEISNNKLSLPDVAGPFSIENYTVSEDGNWILIQARARNAENAGPYHWVFGRKSGMLRQVPAGRDVRISPGGDRILFSEQGNLFIYDMNNDQTTALTNDAVDGSISYGRAVWSPDGKKVVFVQSDVSRLMFRATLIPGDPTYPEVRQTRYARVGGNIPVLKIGVVDDLGKEIRWLSIPIHTEGFYLGEVNWAGNSDEVLVEQMSRFRDKREFFIANVNTGEIKIIFEESDPAWVVASYSTNIGLEWTRDYSEFVVLSERDGWRHAYLCSRDGKQQKLLTPGEYDIIERLRVDHANGWFYFAASPENGTQKYLFRVSLNGSGEPERITPMNQSGTHNYILSADAKWAFHTYSNANQPPVTQLVQLPEHKVVRNLEDNKELRARFESLQVQPKEFFQLDIGNGIEVDGWMIKPKDFDPSYKYPVFIYVYGEPHAQTVIDSWGNAMADFHRVIADLGYLVVSFDNRGTPCPKGAAWRRVISGSLGPLSTEEQELALKELGRVMPFADLSRVGIWGWSGGGSNTLNALFRKPDTYHLGIAVVPKPQPHLYNAWFQEIYMKTPAVNPGGYYESAPINFADGLKGNLLIIHGSGETNTHLQIVEGLVDRLIELGKEFDFIAYPNRDHGLREGQGTTLHVRIYMARYLMTHLPAGPR